jgi:hypothetical protein
MYDTLNKSSRSALPEKEQDILMSLQIVFCAMHGVQLPLDTASNTMLRLIKKGTLTTIDSNVVEMTRLGSHELREQIMLLADFLAEKVQPEIYPYDQMR